MENLYIAATISSPEVRFDAAQQILEMTGESYPENTAEFYLPIIRVLQEAVREPDLPFTLSLEIIYANSSSSKVLMDMLDMLDEAAAEGKTVNVNWYYNADNENAKEVGEEFQEDIESLSFHLLTKESDES